MTLVTATVEDIVGAPDNTVWRFASVLHGDGSEIVTPRWVPYTPAAGVISIELDPGYSTVAYRGKEYVIEVPASGTADLWDLLAASAAFPPGTPPALVAQAVMAYLDAHRDTLGALVALIPTAVKTSGYAVSVSDLVPADASSAGFTISLPSAPLDKSMAAVKKIDATTNTVTVQRSGSDVFNTAGGPSTLQLTLPGESVWLQYKASSGIWYVVYHGVPPTSLDTRYDARYLGIGDVPAVDQLLDSSGNHVVITRGSNFVDLTLAGSDTDIDWYTELKGNAKWRLWMQDDTKPATIRADGPATTVALHLESKGGAGITADGDPIVTAASTHAATGKATPVDADEFPIVDSAASNVLKKVTFANLKAWVKAYYDSATSTLTNKRVTPRVSTTTSSATPTINTDNVDVFGLTAQAADITSFTTNLSGTPTNYQPLSVYIVGTGARTITWGASFEAGPTALPTTTVTTQRLDVGFRWNAATSKWRCMAAGSA